jgi:hypothetical protein
VKVWLTHQPGAPATGAKVRRWRSRLVKKVHFFADLTRKALILKHLFDTNVLNNGLLCPSEDHSDG